MNTWICSGCGESNEADFIVCWSCGAHADGTAKDAGFVRDDAVLIDDGIPQSRELACLRCGSAMQAVGRKRFHEGTRVFPLLYGNIGELFVNRESFDTYACSSCGKIEFFLIDQK